jgi:hypothetical protein
MNRGSDQGELGQNGFSSSAMTYGLGDDSQNQHGGNYLGGYPFVANARRRARRG